MNNTVAVIENTSSIKGHFGAVDYGILIVALLVSLLVGVISGCRKNINARDFLTGSRDMNPFAVCLSLLGGVISAISVQGNATEMYLYGTQLWMTLIGCFFGIFVVMFLLLPVLYPLNLVSMCQYLEMRFSSPLLKKLGSMLQITNSIMYLGVCLYAPSLTLSATIGIPLELSLIVFGFICGIYITLGGVRAVIYTDVVQTTLMFVGVVAVVIQVLIDLGGFQTVWSIAEKGKRLEFFNMDPDPMLRHTFWSVQILGLYFIVSVLGVSQAQFQRLSSVRSLKISQWLCVAFFVGLTILWSLFYFSGVVAYAAYSECDPVESGKIEKADQIMAYMVGDKLSHLPGMVGVFVSAVAGALLSSLSSQANSMVVLIWEDFLSSWWIFAKMTQEMATKMTKILSAAMILLAIGSALLVSQMGTLFQAAYSISGAVIGPFDGLFVTAISAPWVNRKGAICGFSSAIVINMWLVIGKFYYGAGSSEPLPTSTAGCQAEDLLARSAYNVSLPQDIISLAIPATNSSTPLQDVKTTDYWPIYDISYCYLGTIGILIVFIVSSIVSFITGAVKPKDVDRRLVNAHCFRIYCWLCGYKAELKETPGLERPVKEALDTNINLEALENGEKGPDSPVEGKKNPGFSINCNSESLCRTDSLQR